MTAANFAGRNPTPNTGVNRHMPFAQKAFSDVRAFWNVDEWELPAGARMAEGRNKDQAAIYLPDEFPTPLRVQLRILTASGSDKRQSSVEGTQYSFSCAGRLFYKSEKNSERGRQMYTTLFYRAVARPAGLTPRFN